MGTGRVVKLGRAHGGCLGAKSRRRTGRTPKCHGELYASMDPWMSEWGNPLAGSASTVC